MIRKLIAAILATALGGGVPASPAMAKAHLIAVIPLRSDAASREFAQTATRDLMSRLSAIAGYDAAIISPGSRRDIDAAAAAGAELQVVGQVLADGPEATIASYDVATDHRIGSVRTHLERNGALPAAVDITSLVPSQSSPVANATAVPSEAGTYLLVPFGQPGNKDTALDFATTEFVKKMESKGKQLVTSEAMDQVEAASSFPKLCKDHAVRGILVGTARHEQRLNVLLGSYPTHAEVRVTLFDCSGSALWKGYGTGDIVYYWNNAGAAISDVIGKALDTVVAQFSDAAVASPSPAPSMHPS